MSFSGLCAAFRARMYCDLQHVLGCIRSLPSDDLNNSETPNWGMLDEFVVQRFGGKDGQ